MTDGEALSRNVVGEWVRTRRVGNPIAKLILQLAFDHAGPQEDGRWVSWVSFPELAWEACLADGANGARTVRRHVADLEEAGLVEREERTRPNGSRTSNRIVLLVKPEEIPARADRRARPDSPVRTPRTPQSGAPGLPSPVQKPLEEAPPEAPPSPAGTGEARAAEQPSLELVAADAQPPAQAPPPKVSYRGRRVPDDVVRGAEHLLGVFCQETGRRVSAFTGQGKASPAMTQVLGAMLDRPDSTVDEWAAGIRAVVARPPDWWDGPPQIGHVFGQRAAEWTLAAAQAPTSAGRSATVGHASRRGRERGSAVADNIRSAMLKAEQLREEARNADR